MGYTEDIEDAELLKRFMAKDEAAFNALYSKYRLPLFSYIHRLLPNSCNSTIDDYFQQVWIKVLANLSGYDERQKFFAWICRIAHNLVIDSYRRNAGRQYVELVENISNNDNSGSMAEKMEQNEMLEQVELYIAELPPPQREVLEYRRAGLSFKEIAERTGTNMNTVLGRMHYAVAKLKESLKDCMR